MNEIKINKQAKSITFIKNGIAFSQFGIAKEILDLVDNQQQKIDRSNNIIDELEKYIHNELVLDFYNDDMPCELIINKMEKMIKELKENK